MRIKSFRNEKRKQYYFRVYNGKEEQVIKSEAYNSKASRDNGISSFKKNAHLEERYERLTAADGKFYFNMKAANGQVIATSLMFDSEAQRDATIQEIIDYASSAGKKESVSIEKTAASAPPPTTTSKAVDEYQSLDFYKTSGTDTQSGFDSFQKGDDGAYYFSFKSDDGKVLLLSQAYGAEAGRDNGINSVKKNALIEERYSTHFSDDGKYYFSLKAGNHQEIARSVYFDSEEEINRALTIVMKGGGAMEEPKMQKAAAMPNAPSGRTEDEYMDAVFYQESGTEVKSGFDRFQKGDDNAHYFSFKSDDGKVLLLSQAYTAEAGRDNGISSVEKNATVEKRYTTHTTDDGQFYFTLKAGNHQEIAKSVYFSSEDEMKRAMSIVMKGGGTMAEPKMEKAAAMPKAASGRTEDEYMDAAFYQDSGNDVKSDFDRFRKGDDNAYYFSYRGSDGNVLLKSQAYTAESGRDNGIKSVMKNSKIEKRYSEHKTDNGKYYFSLKAGNHQEIAQSVEFDSEAAMQAAMKTLMSSGEQKSRAQGIAAKATPPPAAATEEKKETAAKGNGMDDYRTFGFYKESETGVQNGWDKFYSEKHDEHYFSYKVDGEPVLISEGYSSAAARDNGIASVEKNWASAKRYKYHETKGGRFYYTITAGNHQEIARSKWYATAEERDGGTKWLMAGGLGVAAASGTAMKSSLKSEEAESLSAVSLSSSSEGGTIGKTTKDAEDDYLPCKEYEGHEVNDKINKVAFFKHENGQFYFAVYKEDGSVRLRSEGFQTAKERDVELSGLLKNIDNPDMYKSIKRGKYTIHILKDKTGREVGRSCLETEATPAAAIAEPVALAATAAAVSTSEVVVETTKDAEDDYLPCKEYEGHEVNDKINRVAFFKHENGQFYFAVYKEDGSVRLRSEGFRTAQERDVELSGLLKNLDNPDMYEHINRGKYTIHILKDKTGREVGRSCLETEAAAVTPTEAAPAVATAAAATLAAVSMSSDEEKKEEVEVAQEPEDDYLPCKAYEGHEIGDKINRVAFFKNENGKYYFAIYKENGEVRLRSEGFVSAQNRDSELSGLLKNIDNAEMYETVNYGKYNIHILRDKTGREVGRSCLEKEVTEVAPPVAETAAAAGIAAVAVSAVSASEEKVVVPKPKEDDYLPCNAYEGHAVNDKENNVAFFKHENGQFYFVVYKKDGSVKLRSEGFESAKERDVELSGLLKNIDKPEMYETLSRGKYRIHILKDKTGREVGRSCLETIEEKKVAAPAPVVEVAAATAVAAAAVSAVKVEKEKDKEDDYLPCKEYEGHRISDKKNNVAFFRKNGQFYFVIYKADGKTVRLRSEGFRKSKGRDAELSAALRNLNNKDAYETLTRGKYSLHILKDEKGREVGRSCLETESNPVAVVPVVAAAGAGAAALAAAALATKTTAPEPTPPIKVEKEVITPAPVVVPKKKKKKAAVVVPPVAAAAPVAAASTAAAAGGFNWKWLLLLLPLLLALFWFMKGCDGCGGDTNVTPTKVETPKVETPKVVPPVVIDTVEKKVEPTPVPAATTCNCSGNSNALFNIPSGRSAKVLTVLGTNPEFGNSHSLDPAGFYNKLKTAAANNPRDKRFLDNAFKGMGYANGFAAANAGMFSNARVPVGTTGNMGYSKKHRTVYAKLNTQGKDLEAFRIKAANGCDLHFMKTCGNHFFFCPN